LRGVARSYEVMLYCHGRDPGQVDRLAEVV
jgi:hypothetical protein